VALPTAALTVNKWLLATLLAGLVTAALQQVGTDRRAANDLRRELIAQQSQLVTRGALAIHTAVSGESSAAIVAENCIHDVDLALAAPETCSASMLEQLRAEQDLYNEARAAEVELRAANAVIRATFTDDVVIAQAIRLYEMGRGLRRLGSPSCARERAGWVSTLEVYLPDGFTFDDNDRRALVDSVTESNDAVGSPRCEVDPTPEFFRSYNRISDALVDELNVFALAVNESSVRGRDESLNAALRSLLTTFWPVVIAIAAFETALLVWWLLRRRKPSIKEPLHVSVTMAMGTHDVPTGSLPDSGDRAQPRP